MLVNSHAGIGRPRLRDKPQKTRDQKRVRPSRDRIFLRIGGRAMADDLDKLLELARGIPVSAEERERQRRSFAYGNTRIENDRITRATIDRAADKLAASTPKSEA